MDLRTPVPLQAEHRLHHRSVLSVCASEDYIYSAGEDKKVYVWDRRVTKLMQKLSVRGSISFSRISSFCTPLVYRDNSNSPSGL